MVFVIKASIDSDFPIPISSARIPPPISELGALDLALVTACRNLKIISKSTV